MICCNCEYGQSDDTCYANSSNHIINLLREEACFH